MIRVWVLAASVMIIGLVIYFACLPYLEGKISNAIWWGIPFIGAFVGSQVASNNKFKEGFVTFVPASIILGMSYFIGCKFWNGDCIGLQGILVAILLSLPFILLSSGFGAFVGSWLAHE